MMAVRTGAVVNISSIAAWQGMPGFDSYAAGKAGVEDRQGLRGPRLAAGDAASCGRPERRRERRALPGISGQRLRHGGDAAGRRRDDVPIAYAVADAAPRDGSRRNLTRRNPSRH